MSNTPLVQTIEQLLAFNESKKYKKAIDFAEYSLSIFPNQPQILMLLAFAEAAENHLMSAEKHIQSAFENGEQSAYCYYVQAVILEKQNKLEQAKQAYFTAWKLEPSHTYHSHYLVLKQNLANSTLELLDTLKGYDDFVQKYPNDYMGYQNRSVVLKKLGLYQLALCDIEQCLSLKPDYALGWCNRALTLNLLGQFEQGWQDYLWRYQTDLEEYSPPAANLKLWQGETLTVQDKLLIVVEQGFGDNIQFVRYAILAKQYGIDVAVLNHFGIENLLTYNLAKYGVQTVKNGTRLPDGFSHYVPMMSLPYCFSTRLDTIPLAEPYLTAEPVFLQKWQSKISSDVLNIGIVWAGSAKHGNNLARSLDLTAFRTLLKYPAKFHCLQKVITQDERIVAKSVKNLTLWDEELEDFSDTAALVSQMDLVISVDTSVAHLAAAMGKTTWILLSFDPDFRWLLERTDSPWYSSVKLFRQGINYDWQDVLNCVYAELEKIYQ